MSNYLITDPVTTGVTDWVIHKLGYPVITVELDEKQLEYAFNEAIEEYSSLITEWAITTHIDNALGLPSSQDFTARWVSQSFNFHEMFTKAYAVQAGVSQDFNIYKDYIVLSAGQKSYQIKGAGFTGNDGYSGGRIINEVLWYATPAIMRYIIEPWADFNWVNNEFGWAYMGNSLFYVTPLYYSIQMAMNTELRDKIRKSEFQYKIVGDNIYLDPTPTDSQQFGYLWYWYWKEEEIENPYSLVSSGAVVNNPGTIHMDEIPYTSFNSMGKKWVKKYTLAIAKETLGRIRGKFLSLNIPGAEVQLDGQQLEAEAKEEQRELKEHLMKLLEETSVEKLLSKNAQAAEDVNRSLTFNPMGIYLG